MQEKENIYSWGVYLQDCEDENDGSLSELLAFMTGADGVPPMGFDSKIILGFYDQIDGNVRYSFASTCAPMLYLPRGVDDPDNFKVFMKRALTGSYGFGKV